jgi:hypothetical protein
MWQQTEDRNGDGEINFYDKLNYKEALAGASTCNTGGYTDWRLPTIKELYSLAMFYGAEPGPESFGSVKYIDTTCFSTGYGDLSSLRWRSIHGRGERSPYQTFLIMDRVSAPLRLLSYVYPDRSQELTPLSRE